MMRRFRVFDLALDSDVAFPELEPSPAPAPDLVLRSGEEHDAPPPDADWFHALHLASEDAWLRVGRHAGAFVMQFRDFLTLQVAPPDLTWWRDPDLPDDSLRHVLLNQALPMIVAHAPRTVLHAACVALDGRAVLIAGPAGAGKSTLAAALASRGWHSAGDDAVAVACGPAGARARVAYAGLRLWPDACVALGVPGGTPVISEDGKRQFRTARQGSEDLPVSAICLLATAGPCERASLRPLSAREAVMGLIRNAYVLDTQDRARAASHLAALSRLAKGTTVCELRTPRGFEAFDDIQALLGRQLASQASPCP